MRSSPLRERIFDLLYSQMKPEHAVLQLNQILKTSPERSEALALKAYAINKLANTRKDWALTQHALVAAERALQLNPSDTIGLISKGWALIDLGRAKEAVEPLTRATKLDSQSEYAWYNLAWAQYLTGDAIASKQSIDNALRINPGNPIVKRGKEMMEKGHIPDHLKSKQ